MSRTTHSGLYDLAVSANESAETGLVRVFAFDGTRYRVSQCFEVREKVAKPAACANTSQ
jgi:hypothetical protein